MAAIFAEIAVATSVIRNLVTKSLDYLKDQLSAPDKAKLQQSLTSKLTTVQAIFDAVDQNMILEAERPALDEWLWQMRTATEKADEALDELEYYSLKKETSMRKLSTSSRLLKLHLGPPMSLKFHSTLKKLMVGIEGLDSVLSGVGNFIHIVNHLHRQDIFSDRETRGRLMIHKVFGRGAEKEQLVQWLTTTRSARENVVSIAIIGFGGIGKTTIVQFICEDERVLKHFSENIVWIHVSKQFDPAALTRKIIESITKKRHSAETLDVLQACLEELLLSRRFLLILDDAWEDLLFVLLNV